MALFSKHACLFWSIRDFRVGGGVQKWDYVIYKWSLRPDELCLQYEDCPTFPCYLGNCSKIPISDVDECVKATCWTIPAPGPLPPSPSRYELLVGSIVSVLSISTIVILILLRNKLKMYIRTLRSLLNKQATLSEQGGIFFEK